MSEGFTYKISPFIIEVCGKEPKEYVHQVDVKYTAYVNTNTSIISSKRYANTYCITTGCRGRRKRGER